ncbi:HlyD family secretion protein [Allosphingosinicella flava]|uniref:HlyD family secretion protein n=1 Tax=Allosphingosinicella flava TaxID=2771430 RepID=A0A7T2GJP1_9SPHN|nr:HlyD family secretion protein [Sphingosinicella flava]QPQ55100.1 HlyD family secretion protein [Sphingosinicella flava]
MSDTVMTADTAPSDTKPKKPAWRTFLMLSVPLLLAIVGGYFWLTSGRYVATDNAYVAQDKVSVSAEVGGAIAQVHVRENQRVKKGDLLFVLDQRPYRLALAQAEAQMAAARVQVNQLQTASAGTGADIEGARANLAYTQKEFSRYAELLERGFTTRVRYEEAQHAVQEARERLANAEADAATARAALAGEGATNQPAVEAARVAREKALLDLQRTEIRAPADGFVSQADRLQAGNAVVAGVPVLTIVRSGDTWVEANYKETDLAKMTVGQPAEIELDAYPGLKVQGHVASIGAGTGSEFSVLPAQNATGNWVKVTQRVPVRIALDETPGRPFIAGLSAEVTVDTEGRASQRVATR